MNLAIAFSTCAEKNARKTAIFWGDHEIAYAELLAQSRKIASHLQNRFGVKSGDHIALWLKNRPEFPMSVFGVLHALQPDAVEANR